MISSFIGSESCDLLRQEHVLSDRGISTGFNLISEARRLSSRRDVFDILASEAARAEKSAPYASRLMLMHLDDELKSSPRYAFHRSHLERIIGLSFDKNIRSIVSTVVNEVGLRPTWIVSDDPTQSWLVHAAFGQQFTFIPTHQNVHATLTDVRIVVMDAFIESVHEINSLLEECSAEGVNTIIIARGYGNDVVSTLNLNRVRGTLRVYAFVCKFDENGINTLKDIAIVSGARLLSTADGQLIGSYRLVESGICRVCHLSGHQVTLECTQTENVLLHMETLRNRIEVSQDASGDLLVHRLNSLAGERVVVRTPNTISKVQLRYDLDRCLRSIRDAARWGVVSVDDTLYPANSVLVARRSLVSLQEALRPVLLQQQRIGL